MISTSTAYNSRYVSFQEELVDDILAEGTDSISDSVPATLGLIGNGVMGDEATDLPKRFRLRAVETEAEYYLKQMDTDLLRKLVTTQAVASVLIVLSQVVLYAIVTRQNYKAIDYAGVGMWGPLIFFSTACWLTWSTTTSPSGCSIGTAMGFQITSIAVGIFLLIFASISLIQHGQYSYWDEKNGAKYDPEVTGRIFCSLMILAGITVTVAATVVSVLYCKLTCCARANAHETIMFDVEKV